MSICSAFSLLASLVVKLCPVFHVPSMAGLHAAQADLAELLRRALPEVNSHLKRLGVPIKESSTAWLLCAFVDVLPLPSTLRVWDVFFSGGSPVLLHAAVGVVALHERTILAATEDEPLSEDHVRLAFRQMASKLYLQQNFDDIPVVLCADMGTPDQSIVTTTLGALGEEKGGRLNSLIFPAGTGEVEEKAVLRWKRGE